MTSPITDERLKEILAGTEGVTPGPWTACLHIGIPDAHIRAEIHGCNICDVIEGTESTRGRVSHDDMQANAKHIGRLDPATVSAIVSELLAAREALRPFADYAEAIEPGEWASDEGEIGEQIVGGLRRSIKLGDLRRARSLSGKRSGK